MANAVKLGGTSLITDMALPVIASPTFLLKMKDNALNYENYSGLDDYDGVSKLMHGGFTTNWDFEWEILELPVLVLTGHHDKIFRIEEDINDLIKKIKNVTRIEVPECGHLIPIEDPKLFSYHLDGFLASLRK